MLQNLESTIDHRAQTECLVIRLIYRMRILTMCMVFRVLTVIRGCRTDTIVGYSRIVAVTAIGKAGPFYLVGRGGEVPRLRTAESAG